MRASQYRHGATFRLSPLAYLREAAPCILSLSNASAAVLSLEALRAIDGRRLYFDFEVIDFTQLILAIISKRYFGYYRISFGRRVDDGARRFVYSNYCLREKTPGAHDTC